MFVNPAMQQLGVFEKLGFFSMDCANHDTAIAADFANGAARSGR